MKILDSLEGMVKDVHRMAERVARHDRDLASQMKSAANSAALNGSEGVWPKAGKRRSRLEDALSSDQLGIRNRIRFGIGNRIRIRFGIGNRTRFGNGNRTRFGDLLFDARRLLRRARARQGSARLRPRLGLAALALALDPRCARRRGGCRSRRVVRAEEESVS